MSHFRYQHLFDLSVQHNTCHHYKPYDLVQRILNRPINRPKLALEKFNPDTKKKSPDRNSNTLVDYLAAVWSI